MSIKNNIIGIIKSPAETFKDMLKSGRNLYIPIVIMLFNGFTGGVTTYIQRNKSIEQMKELYAQMGQQLPHTLQEQVLKEPNLLNEIIRSLMLAILSWIVIVALYFTMSKLLRGKGDYLRMLELIGYARIPTLIGNLVVLPLIFITPFLSMVSLLFFLWSLILDVIAVREVNEFSTGKAVIAVVIPIAVIAVIAIMVTVIFTLTKFGVIS